MISRSGIEEANKHIQALNGRIHELENIAKEQHNAMTAKDSFIQTKIQELMTQDRKIKELSERLNVAYGELNDQNRRIESLESSISAKDLHILKLQKHNDQMTKIFGLIPDLNEIIEKINMVHKEVTAEPAPSYTQDEASESNSAADDGNTEIFIHEDSHLHNNTQVFSEMARTLAKTQKRHKFSISDDDTEEISANISPSEKSVEKEFYL